MGQRGHTVYSWCVPVHVSVVGNEMADEVAASRPPDLRSLFCLNISHRTAKMRSRGFHQYGKSYVPEHIHT